MTLAAHQLFERHAEATPEAIAVVCDGAALTYQELDSRANRLARHLRDRGLSPGAFVGVFLNRSLEMPIAVLAALKAGAAYVPVDAAYPQERIASMLADAPGIKLVLTTEHLRVRLPPILAPLVVMDREWPEIASCNATRFEEGTRPADLAYVIFTSGSTGRPKGASVRHIGWSNLLTWFVREFELTSHDRVLVVSAFGFDITQRALLMPLVAGGELHLYSAEHYDPAAIRRAVARSAITVLNCAPSLFYPLIEYGGPSAFDELRTLRWLFLGGEAIAARRLRLWADSGHCRAGIVNVYGAAECTDVSSFYRLADFERYERSSAPIGRAIANTQIYVLDEDLNALPPGVPGEICIGGIGVGAGYINDGLLTRQKFVPDHLGGTGGCLYRTGDLGRLRPDGVLEFIGRVDHQVKVRGFRVDLGDVESTIRQYRRVREAVVLPDEAIEGLAAFIVVAETTPAEAPDRGPRSTRDLPLERELREFLNSRLPGYMVPNSFIRLDGLPLTPNGKIDRQALLAHLTSARRQSRMNRSAGR